MPNCSQCSPYNICTACDGNFVVNSTGGGYTFKIHCKEVQTYLLHFVKPVLIQLSKKIFESSFNVFTLLSFQNVQMQCLIAHSVQHIIIALHVMGTLWLMVQVMDA